MLELRLIRMKFWQYIIYINESKNIFIDSKFSSDDMTNLKIREYIPDLKDIIKESLMNINS